MLSMTGFGRSESAFGNSCVLTVEVSTINRKQLEVRVIAPPDLAAFEQNARKIVASCFSRGSIQLRVTIRRSGGAASGFVVDEAALDGFVQVAQAARRRAGLSGAVEVEALMTMPGVISGGASDVDNPEFAEVFEKTVAAACAECCWMRGVEGNALQEDLCRRSSLLKELLAKLEPECAKVPEIAKRRLLAKLSDAAIPVKPDDEILAKELLFYVDKSDVAEELTRLKSHFLQLDNFLAAQQPVGRSLDFLAQEFFREITTLGNKAASPMVSPLVVTFKSELEKMREQIQNVE